MKTLVIIQARMGSERLPGKILQPIAGKPMLYWVLHRSKQAKRIDGVAIATTTNPIDDATEAFAREQQALVHRGSEHDVLTRYIESARAFQAGIIVRITGDCPLVDPDVIDRCIDEHHMNRADYSSNVMHRTFPRGLDTEVFSLECLEYINQKATSAPAREHVTTYLRNEHPEEFHIHHVINTVDRSGFELSIDSPQDVEMMNVILKKVNRPVEDIRYPHLCEHLDQMDASNSLNRQVERKTDHLNPPS